MKNTLTTCAAIGIGVAILGVIAAMLFNAFGAALPVWLPLCVAAALPVGLLGLMMRQLLTPAEHDAHALDDFWPLHDSQPNPHR